jgi:hypothetical protein
MQLSNTLIALVALVPTVLAQTGMDLALNVLNHKLPALHALHQSPQCAQICHLHPKYKDDSGTLCILFNGAERYACLCNDHAYQNTFKKCLKEQQCSGKQQAQVSLLPFSIRC